MINKGGYVILNDLKGEFKYDIYKGYFTFQGIDFDEESSNRLKEAALSGKLVLASNVISLNNTDRFKFSMILSPFIFVEGKDVYDDYNLYVSTLSGRKVIKDSEGEFESVESDFGSILIHSDGSVEYGYYET